MTLNYYLLPQQASVCNDYKTNAIEWPFVLVCETDSATRLNLYATVQPLIHCMAWSLRRAGMSYGMTNIDVQDVIVNLLAQVGLQTNRIYHLSLDTIK